MRHPEIESTRDAKPTWKEILIGIMSLVALSALIAWNQVDGNITQSASNTRMTSAGRVRIARGLRPTQLQIPRS